jgi:hypothetical protein
VTDSVQLYPLLSSCLVQGATATFARNNGLIRSVSRTAGEAVGSFDVVVDAFSPLAYDVVATPHADTRSCLAANARRVTPTLVRVKTSSCGMPVDCDFFLRLERAHSLQAGEAYVETPAPVASPCGGGSCCATFDGVDQDVVFGNGGAANDVTDGATEVAVEWDAITFLALDFDGDERSLFALKSNNDLDSEGAWTLEASVGQSGPGANDLFLSINYGFTTGGVTSVIGAISVAGVVATGVSTKVRMELDFKNAGTGNADARIFVNDIEVAYSLVVTDPIATWKPSLVFWDGRLGARLLGNGPDIETPFVGTMCDFLFFVDVADPAFVDMSFDDMMYTNGGTAPMGFALWTVAGNTGFDCA